MTNKPIAIFDTTAINRFAEPNRADANRPLIAGLKSGFRLRITATNVDEVIATETGAIRERLLKVCQELAGAGEIIQPFHVITERHITEFEKRGGTYDWRRVDVRAPEYERGFMYIDDDLSKAQRKHAAEVAAQFEQLYVDARPAFEELFQRSPEQRPASAADLVKALQVPGGAFWAMGIKLYAAKAKNVPDEDTIRRFVHACPPFRALLMACFVAQHDRCDRTLTDAEQKKLAKRNDLFMSAYLPYCDEFISDDRDQIRCLREVVCLANLNTEILWYGQLTERLAGNLPNAVTGS
jgi:hypothetical protein